MKVDDLGSPHFPGAEVRLRPAMVLVVVMDDGPRGPCGQSMNVTCPHTTIHIFPDEAYMRDFFSAGGTREGIRERARYCFIGEHSAPGVMNLIRHE